jgi:hypothetical protein
MLYSVDISNKGTALLRRICAISLLLVMPLAGADILLLDGIDAARGSENLRPARGMSMGAVRSVFGAPSTEYGAVGPYRDCSEDRFCPPITRWDYPGFVVYFEHEFVIHTVSTP